MVGQQGVREKATLLALDPALALEVQKALESAIDLSAVERFSQWHAHDIVPALSGLYSELMPTTPPQPGEQYAFEVDLNRCSSCKACVAACHSLNGLDEGESWRTVGSLLGKEEAAQITVTSSCHHCVEPGCAAGCPTLAYQKDELTGIVQHLDDQCMGCQYCMWTCPYDAPKWNARLGIVRKCDMCHGRLEEGEAPACAQACPSQAIRIVKVQANDLRQNPTYGTVLPSIVGPEATLPTTQYLGLSTNDLHSPDEQNLLPEHGHVPLAALLVMTQWASGIWLLNTLRDWLVGYVLPMGQILATGLLVVGLVVGSLHLGRPERAWKAFLGWRKSWFSREVLAFGAAAAMCLGAVLAQRIASMWMARAFTGLALFALLAGVGCSILLYMVTPRPAWARSNTAWRFVLTAVGGGAVVLGAFGGDGIRLCGAISIIAGVAKVLLVRQDRLAKPGIHPALLQQARLLIGPLKQPAVWQFRLFGVAVAWAVLGTILAQPFCFVLAVAFRFASDMVERVLFFKACPATKMPGGAGHV